MQTFMERRIFFYCNPFNPSPKIKYGIKERSFVELKAYDILGIEIKTIVNAEQDAGYYEIEFSAIGGSLPAGTALPVEMHTIYHVVSTSINYKLEILLRQRTCPR